MHYIYISSCCGIHSSCLQKVVAVLGGQTEKEHYLRTNPAVVAAALDVVWQLWQSNFTGLLRNNESFWHHILASLSYKRSSEPSDSEDQGMRLWYYQTVCQVTVYEILKQEALSTVGTVEKRLADAIAKNVSNSLWYCTLMLILYCIYPSIRLSFFLSFFCFLCDILNAFLFCIENFDVFHF